MGLEQSWKIQQFLKVSFIYSINFFHIVFKQKNRFLNKTKNKIYLFKCSFLLLIISNNVPEKQSLKKGKKLIYKQCNSSPNNMKISTFIMV